MTTESDVLRGRKRAFVAALAGGLSQADAARAVGVTPRTANRYMHDPGVRLALAQIQDAALGDVCRRMAADAREMLGVLTAVAKDAAMPPTVRVRAAASWLEMLFRAKELWELNQRVSDLEAKIREGDG